MAGKIKIYLALDKKLIDERLGDIRAEWAKEEERLKQQPGEPIDWQNLQKIIDEYYAKFFVKINL